MRFWQQRNLGWAVLSVTLLSLPAPLSAVCACPRNVMTEAQVVSGPKSGCPRCQPTAAAVSTSASSKVAQISQASCCKSKVSDARSAAAPAKIELERHETRNTMPAAVAPTPASRNSATRSTRAPPLRGTRDSASPPASYLSDYLRL